MKLMNVKGTYDYLPKDMKIRKKIIDILANNFEKYGYLPIETPIINYYDLLSYKYGNEAEILKEIYRLKDQGDRDLGLRYDLTVPFCKVVGMYKDLPLPFRRYEIGRVFRNGPVKPGRTREFYQCDVDVVGIDDRYIEAEQIYMAINTYQELGIEVIVKYNNRKLMSGIILECGIPVSKVDSVIGIIDKLEKVSKQELVSMLRELSISDTIIDKLFSLFSKTIQEYELISGNNLFKEGILEVQELNNYLESLGIMSKCQFTPTLARGLSIYTGTVFEFYDKLNRVKSAIGGGGRYNKIITNFMNNGKEYPACGLSFGLEPLFVILKEEEQDEDIIDIYMVPLGEDKVKIETLKLANTFRKMNYRVLIEMNNKKISKCFEYADRENIKYVMIIGSNEINSGIFKIKNMSKKEEYSFDTDKLKEYLTSNSK